MKTGWQSLKLALAGFIVPFMFVYNPTMMMIDVSNVDVMAKTFPLPAWHLIAVVTVTSIVGVLALSASVEGYLKTLMPMWQRVVMAIGACCLIVPETITDIIGIVLVVAMVVVHFKMGKPSKA